MGHYNRSPEGRARWLGRKHRQESIEKMRQASIGKPGPNKGRKFPEEIRKKVSAARAGKPWSDAAKKSMKDRWVRNQHPMKGKKHTQATRDEMSKRKIELIVAGQFVPYNRASGEFYSEKNGRWVHYRSMYERTAYTILEQLKKVVSYDVEPFCIKYLFEGRVRRYVPDLLVKYDDGLQELIEIKPVALVNEPMNVAKRRAAEAYCTARGIKHSVWTERTLRLA